MPLILSLIVCWSGQFCKACFTHNSFCIIFPHCCGLMWEKHTSRIWDHLVLCGLFLLSPCMLFNHFNCMSFRYRQRGDWHKRVFRLEVNRFSSTRMIWHCAIVTLKEDRDLFSIISAWDNTIVSSFFLALFFWVWKHLLLAILFCAHISFFPPILSSGQEEYKSLFELSLSFFLCPFFFILFSLFYTRFLYTFLFFVQINFWIRRGFCCMSGWCSQLSFYFAQLFGF